MALLVIPAKPVLNVSGVQAVLETDPVISDFINTYFQIFLSNDQALRNLIDTKPDIEELSKVAGTGAYKDLTGLPYIPSGNAADYDVANNDTTTAEGFVADARIVRVHGCEIDQLAEFLTPEVTDAQIKEIFSK